MAGRWGARLGLLLAAVALLSAAAAQMKVPAAPAPALQAPTFERRWVPLAQDGIHDPAVPSIHLKQQPAEALAPLAPDTAGNQVRWLTALEQGQINPRATLAPGGRVRVADDDILLNLNGGTPIVRFPHKAHTLWLDCSNCHNEIFIDEAGANKLSMDLILQGEQCGICHGAVAFPLTECKRCHSVPRKTRTARSQP